MHFILLIQSVRESHIKAAKHQAGLTWCRSPYHFVICLVGIRVNNAWAQRILCMKSVMPHCVFKNECIPSMSAGGMLLYWEPTDILNCMFKKHIITQAPLVFAYYERRLVWINSWATGSWLFYGLLPKENRLLTTNDNVFLGYNRVQSFQKLNNKLPLFKQPEGL